MGLPRLRRRPGPRPRDFSVTSAPQERAVLDFYCVTCHKGAGAPAGLALDKLDPANVEKDADKWEKVVRKLRAGMMPPAGMPRPSRGDLRIGDRVPGKRARQACGSEISASGPSSPEPRRIRERDSRPAGARYRSLRSTCLPTIPPAASTISPARCRISPALLEGYTSAAGKISRLAIGDVTDATSRPPIACRQTLRRIITSKACRSAPAAAWSRSTSSRPTAITCSRFSPSTRA